MKNYRDKMSDRKPGQKIPQQPKPPKPTKVYDLVFGSIFSRARSLDMAIVSVGALTPHSVFYEYGLLTRPEIASLEAAGAVGDVLCHFVDAEGRIVPHPVNDRVLAVNPAELHTTRDLVLVSGGWHKLKVIRAALKLLKPSILIVNEKVAESLAAQPA